MNKCLETVCIEGAEFTLIEKPAALYAGFLAQAPDADSEPSQDGFTRFAAQHQRIQGILTPHTMICLSMHYKEWNHGHKIKRALLHCRGVSQERQPEGIDVVACPPCLLILVKASDAAWALTKKVTGQDNPLWHMAPLFGLIQRLFCNAERGYAPAPDFSGVYEMEYYQEDGAQYAALPVIRRNETGRPEHRP